MSKRKYLFEKPSDYRYSKQTPYCDWKDDWKDYKATMKLLNKHPEYKGLPTDEIDKLRRESKRAAGYKAWDGLQRKLSSMNAQELEKLNRSKGNGWKNLSDEQKLSRRRKRSEANKQYWEQFSAEDRSEILKSRSQKISDSTKRKMIDARIEGFKKWYANLSDDEKHNHYCTMRTAFDKKMESDPSFKKQMQDQLADARKLYQDSLTDEDRKKISQRVHDWWENITPEMREYISSQAVKRNNEWWNSRTPEQLSEISSRVKKFNETYRASLTDEEYAKIRKKALTKNSAAGRSSMHDKFEQYFNDSIISNGFYYEAEHTLISNGVAHTWDYAVYDKITNKLVLVVDLDGKFFHADSCDYNGMHSIEEYDESRFVTVPNGVKCHIIYEQRWKQSFEEMIKLLMIDYEDFLNSQFELCRSMPFPFPNYSDDELMRSWKQLVATNCSDKYHQNVSLNTRVGDRIIYNFHHSIYMAHVGNKMSPYSAWYDDETLRSVIRNRIIYANKLNPNKILQGFNICKVAPKVSVFSAGRAKMIITKYLNEFDTIFDPFSGFSGRMLGTISLGKQYIGQDLADAHVAESNNIINFLRDHDVVINATIVCKDIMDSFGTYECLFTCPPYGTKEVWVNQKGDNLSCDEWIDVCISRFNCKRYVFVIDKTEKYLQYVVDTITNRSHLGTNNELIVVIDKE